MEDEKKLHTAEWRREYYHLNKDTIDAYHAQYVIDHKEDVAAYQKAYHAEYAKKNKERCNAATKRYADKQRAKKQAEQLKSTESQGE
jgi:recombinational DNA repair protein (RecF pathway)